MVAFWATQPLVSAGRFHANVAGWAQRPRCVSKGSGHVIQRFEVEPLPSFLMADKTKALHHVPGDQLSGKMAQFIGRRKRQPRAFRSAEGYMPSTQNLDHDHGRFEGRRQVVAAPLVGLEDANRGHLLRPLRLDKILDALLDGPSICAS